MINTMPAKTSKRTRAFTLIELLTVILLITIVISIGIPVLGQMLEITRGRAGSGRNLLLTPGSAEAAANIFYQADHKTYGATYDFLALAQEIPEAIHYRIAIDNREYQRTLSQLQFLSMTAARHGRGLRIRL